MTRSVFAQPTIFSMSLRETRYAVHSRHTRRRGTLRTVQRCAAPRRSRSRLPRLSPPESSTLFAAQERLFRGSHLPHPVLFRFVLQQFSELDAFGSPPTGFDSIVANRAIKTGVAVQEEHPDFESLVVRGHAKWDHPWSKVSGSESPTLNRCSAAEQARSCTIRGHYGEQPQGARTTSHCRVSETARGRPDALQAKRMNTDCAISSPRCKSPTCRTAAE